ncbi:MAG TPA: NAD(P)/FAD-dependent oxidoreductase [Candidatus Baltobacteraceae bacterium]|jgi:protoporphyrinogen oxidase|nr:NAD(P)/FAD-dependent oxidoreductase [Candidatus Baltobacteraceae bacterium]
MTSPSSSRADDAATRFAIVGGGMLGMTLALRLRQRGHDVDLIEASGMLGGLAQAWSLGSVTWDRHYHVILRSDQALRSLLDELGLESEIEWATPRTGFFTDGRFADMSGLLDFLRFPPLNLIDKFRLGITILHASRIVDGRPLEAISVEDWLRRWSGRRTFQKIWRPLLRAKLGERYRETSAAFIWAIVARMYAARRSGLGREMFGYVPGGYARILATFTERLRSAGVHVELNAPVERIERDGEAPLRIVFRDGQTRTYDRVVVTAAAPLAARLCPQLGTAERRSFQDIPYQGIVCASVLLDEPLGPYYITNLTDDGLPFSAVIEMSAIVSRKEFGGNALVYLPKYVAPNDPLFEKSDEEIRTDFLDALRRMYPHFAERKILAFAVSRVREVFAIASLGYSDRLPSISTSIRGLFLANSAHIVNGTLNVNETILLADRALSTIDPVQVSNA